MKYTLLCSADAVAVLYAGFGAGSGPIHLDDVRCTGSETGLVNCTYDSVTTDCSHTEDAGVRCSVTRKSVCHISGKIKTYSYMTVRFNIWQKCPSMYVYS